MDWNDLKYLLAVADTGSTLAASRSLRVSQTTVARRIAALEESIGIVLFDKRQAGYGLTPAGERLLDQARRVSTEAEAFAETASAEAREAHGSVCLTTEEIYANTILVPILQQLREAHPAIRIDLDTSLDVRDLASGEADIALRSMSGSGVPGLVGRRLWADDWTIYCSRDYAEQHGVPRHRAELARHPIIGGGGGSLWLAYEAWLKEVGLDDKVTMTHATSTGVFTAVRAGSGIAILPMAVAEGDPEFIRCLPPRDTSARALWLLTHERLRGAPHVRAVIDFLYDRLHARVEALGLR